MVLSSPEHCCVVESHKIVQREELGKTFRLNNPNQLPVTVCRVDNCMISAPNEIRCDFLLDYKKGAERIVFLVELKGVDHVHAIHQILNTAAILGFASIRAKKKCAIVTSANPKVSTKYQNTLKKTRPQFVKLGLDFPLKKNNVIDFEI